MKSITALLLVASFVLGSCAQLSNAQSGSHASTTSSKNSKMSTGSQAPASPTQTTPSGSTSSSSKSSKASGSSSSSTSTSSSSSSHQSGIGGLSNDQIISGLKEALTVGAQKSSDKLSLSDGFFKNRAIKILMPPEAKDVEAKLRQLGMGSQVDQAILSMNRAAESAAKDAAPIFISAVKGMSFSDATGILTGPNDAATQYLKKTTSSQLTTKFTPVIKSALDKTQATKYWGDVFNTYNKIPFVKKVNPDLTSYVTQKALDGLFYTMAQEEATIRKDPMGTANSIIQTVFGSLLKH